jgi:ankyrin repeat protein
MLAASCNLTDACGVLLDYGANINATDLSGNTALHLAYAFGSMSSVMLLEEKGSRDGVLLDDVPNNSNRTPSEEAGRHIHMPPLFRCPADSD